MTDLYDTAITVHWHCGCFVGPAKWHGDDFEPDECDTDFDTEDTLDVWEGIGCVGMCPTCGAELCQTYNAQRMILNSTTT